MDIQSVGKILLLIGFGITLFGGLLLILGRISNFGNLPGDIRVQSNNFSCFVPITSMIILSIILTVVLNILIRLINR
ncbi:MAG: hypothetical protein Kow00117_10380 [Phototrophicales bacterium]